jgi:hypothetical protein
MMPGTMNGTTPAAMTDANDTCCSSTVPRIRAMYGTPMRNGTMLAATNPTNASTGRRSQARSANQPATNAAGMKPSTKPKDGIRTYAGPAATPAKTGRPASPATR